MFRLKKMICLLSFVLMLFLTSDVQAIIWTNTTGDHLWSTSDNWSYERLPALVDPVRIGLSPGPIIMNGVVAEIQCILLGYDNFTGELTMNGGTLTTQTWIIIGYDQGSRGTLNMNGGTIALSRDLTVRQGVLNITGGTIAAERYFRIEDEVNLDGGVITAKIFRVTEQPTSAGRMDVRGGTLIVEGDQVSLVQRHIDDGMIFAYDNQGTLQLDYNVNEDKTTLKAVHMLGPNPVYCSNVLPANVNQLQWTLPEPSQPGGVVTCDVYFGTNPDVEKNPKIVDCQAVESASVALTYNTIYYWALNLYDSSVSATEPYMLSTTFTFNTLYQPPIVDAGADIITWLQEDIARTGYLDATVKNDNPFPYTVQWRVFSEPNDIDNSDSNAVITDPSAEDTNITLRALGEYVLQLEVFNGEFISSDKVTINVYADSCEAAKSLLDYIPLPGDINGDCRVDDLDLVLLEENWLMDNSLIEEWLMID